MLFDEILCNVKDTSAEYYFEENQRIKVEMESNEIKTIEYKNESGQAIRVSRNGKFGFSSSTNDRSINELYAVARNIAINGIPINIKFDNIKKNIVERRVDPEIGSLDIDRLVKLNSKVLEKVRSIPNTKVTLEKTYTKKIVRNSNEVDCSSENSNLKVKLSKLIIGDNRVSDITCIDYINNLSNIDKVINQFTFHHDNCQRNASLLPGKYPVIFSPNMLSVILSSFITMLNGKKFFTGVSALSDAMNKQIFDSKFSLYDDPLSENGIYNATFDDEGVYTSTRSLIKDGILVDICTDLITSAKFDCGKSTGNGIRRHGFSSMPTPNAHFLRVDEGEATIFSLIESIKKGVYIERLMGVGNLQKNIGNINGAVSLGYVIQDGKIIGKLNNAIINFKLLDIFKDISLSKEKMQVYGLFDIPYLLKHSMDVYI